MEVAYNILALTLKMENALNHDYKTNNGCTLMAIDTNMMTFRW